MQNNDILSVASRRRIFECVTANPGAHLRDLARRCATPLGTCLYHLDCLETSGLIVSRRDGRYKRYFGSHSLGRREKEVVSLLRHSAPRRLVTALLSQGGATQRQLCDAIRVSRSTVSFHLARLVAEGVVGRVPRRPEAVYEVLEPTFTRELLTRFAESLEPSVTTRVIEVAHSQAAVEAPRALG